MQFNPIPQPTISALGRVVESANEVKGYAETLVEGLRACFEAQSPKARWGVGFNVAADKVSAAIDTVFGQARSSLFIEVDGDGVYGRYVIEKKVRGVDGGDSWTPAWAIRIAKDGNIHDGDTGASIFNAWQAFENERTGALHHLAGSILYSIGTTENFPR